MDYKQIAKDVLLLEAKELELASLKISNQIEKAVELISKTKGKLIITGVGKSGLVGTKIAATFASTGTSSFFIHPTEAIHGDLGMIDTKDTVLAISYSGESEELTGILPHLKRFNIPLIAMTKEKNSTLGKYADVFLDIGITKEACPLNIAPTTSTTLTMALGDALAICMMKNKNFKKEDFASFHPGGSLGKQLFIKVKDLLKTNNLPIVNKNTILKDAIVIMSEGMLGNAIVLEDQKVIGLLSDGDLRRAMLNDDFSLDKTIETIMTKNPKSINNIDILASDALKIIEDFKIQLLIAKDKNQNLLGVLHIHSLVQAGIKNV
jgi:arabinose-5-phosphate isomerase